MPHPRFARRRNTSVVSLFRLHFETNADSDALLRVLAFALSLSLTPRRIRAERSDDSLEVEIAYDEVSERSAQLLLARTGAIVSVRRAWTTGAEATEQSSLTPWLDEPQL